MCGLSIGDGRGYSGWRRESSRAKIAGSEEDLMDAHTSGGHATRRGSSSPSPRGSRSARARSAAGCSSTRRRAARAAGAAWRAAGRARR
jgi:hypothetical protein